VILSANM